VLVGDAKVGAEEIAVVDVAVDEGTCVLALEVVVGAF
jgi:hypothetical protein